MDSLLPRTFPKYSGAHWDIPWAERRLRRDWIFLWIWWRIRYSCGTRYAADRLQPHVWLRQAIDEMLECLPHWHQPVTDEQLCAHWFNKAMFLLRKEKHRKDNLHSSGFMLSSANRWRSNANGPEANGKLLWPNDARVMVVIGVGFVGWWAAEEDAVDAVEELVILGEPCFSTPRSLSLFRNASTPLPPFFFRTLDGFIKVGRSVIDKLHRKEVKFSYAKFKAFNPADSSISGISQRTLNIKEGRKNYYWIKALKYR